MSKHIKRVYSVYAGIYDYFFGKLFEHGRFTAFNMMAVKPNETVLEVGVGTGLSLPFYPKEAKITGIDISREMLTKAKDKKEYYHLHNVSLLTMDAMSMDFADNTFDKVIASHVITVVPNPLHALNEIKRVCKKNGEIFILNYVGSNNRTVSYFEKLISPYRDKLGLGKHFNLNELLENADLSPLHEQRVNFLKLCKVVKCRNNAVNS